MRKKDILAQLPPLTESQHCVIMGSLLGDGSLKGFRFDRNSYFMKTQSREKKEYIRWHYDFLQPYSGSIRQCVTPEFTSRTGQLFRRTEPLIFSTHSHPVFTELRSKWYPDSSHNKKRVPKDLQLTPQMLAVWFADDGTTNHENRFIRLCTQGFPEDDVDFLVSELHSRFGFICKKQPDGNGYLIRFSADSYKDFIDLVAPFYPWKCLNHKIDLSEYSELARNNTSGFQGVVWDKARKKWRAEIKVKGKKVHLGRFSEIGDAVEARKVADQHYAVKVGRKWRG